jgi:nucleotide-binding universal stress UspA family protein
MMSTLAPVRITFERLLVPTDFSDVSRRAVEYAKGIARHDGSKILVAHVNPIINTVNSQVTWIDQQTVWRQAEEQLEQEGAELRSLGFQARTISLTGAIESEILAVATRERADLIVLGTHGDTGIERLLLGSEAEALLRNASCPVLVIGPGAQPFSNQLWHPRHVICPSDLVPDSAPIVARAYILSEGYQATFTLLHIASPTRRSSSDELLRFEKALAEILPDEKGAIHRLRTRLSDTPGLAIVDFAMENDADLIVMGAHVAPASATHFLRGIAPQVFGKAPCPVMVLHSS